MIMITIYKDLHNEYSLSYLVAKNNEHNDMYQFVKFHLEDWEVGQYLGGN
jgi:hypothetical protein